ncbi:hypothetical protein FPV67DRAFT_1456807 [Lyophyllum atratum]|nr:hypothetical protein FPV67DRAFT_1456807 [Lyophyllum atratum]
MPVASRRGAEAGRRERRNPELEELTVIGKEGIESQMNTYLYASGPAAEEGGEKGAEEPGAGGIDGHCAEFKVCALTWSISTANTRINKFGVQFLQVEIFLEYKIKLLLTVECKVMKKDGTQPLLLEGFGGLFQNEKQHVELFKLAVQFHTHQAVILNAGEYNTIKATLERLENNMDHSMTFTANQTIRNACRLVVFDPDRTDYTNPTVSGAVLAHVKKYQAVNGFKDHFDADSRTKARAAALKTLIGTEASTIKGQFRLLILAGIFGDAKSGPQSLTATLMVGMLPFKHSSKVPDVKHAVQLLLVHQFARENNYLLQDINKKSSTHAKAKSIPTPFVPDDSGDAKKQKLTGYIAKPIQNEKHDHPDDKMPLIPRRAATLAPGPSTPANQPLLPSPTRQHRLWEYLHIREFVDQHHAWSSHSIQKLHDILNMNSDSASKKFSQKNF